MKGINGRWHGYPLKQLFYFTWWKPSKKSSLRCVIKSKNAKSLFTKSWFRLGLIKICYN
ncbi:hypothetical protein HMPREF1448_01669 [Helicobacter pylori HP260AFi]|uniref:Uncharacterized protein n=1 Tax=Helicobacter pylori HP260AFii TaxID=1159077 RepID=A0ABC9S937_HELPX|nr:hypothetical protein HMPREF1416_00489 [Helicobacter pylori GAM260ASi]EMH27328.1 hypothetical protein HMPREF1422_01508 [Helicobacter pylori GAM268Bii]EMH61445.1 hypothetical protein HMPREF1448_01669 [Helicobacter pylori HP260AFi]EMH66316.1 hypothetical protein HMPREF1450_01134 [Helicobacter pylori HP260ASii]EMH66427.1 hypothetical protein HMPREF1449_00992 [Helicobacter pylori HP260AFii]